MEAQLRPRIDFPEVVMRDCWEKLVLILQEPLVQH